MFKNTAKNKTIVATTTGPKTDRSRPEIGRPTVSLVVYVDMFASCDGRSTFKCCNEKNRVQVAGALVKKYAEEM